MKSDIKIAQEANILPINKIIEGLDISPSNLYMYGDYKAKIEPVLDDNKTPVIIVSAITPTPAGEGKTTTTIGLNDALNKLGLKSIATLREPSLGPVFGLKGSATGGGYNQVIPMEDINLHFTGDMHAITSTNNLICAMIDNSIYQGNELNIDPEQILINRVLDINDRALRDITIGQGKKTNGVQRQDHFDITVACELMAILCLSKDEKDFQNRVENMAIAKTYDDKTLYVKDLNMIGAIMSLMKDCLKPNLVQSLENNPVLIHGGPFANIAHGCCSLIATKTASNLADVVVTEAGFGSDLGFEKFIDIKTRTGKLNVKVAVLVVTLRALKMHGGVELNQINNENIEAIKKGFANVVRHYQNMNNTQIPIIINLNKFETDTQAEIECFGQLCTQHDYKWVLNQGYKHGSDGVIELAQTCKSLLDNDTTCNFIYEQEDDFPTKLQKVVTKSYQANGFKIKPEAQAKYEQIKNNPELQNMLVCIAKTPKSFTDNDKLINAPIDFDITFSDFKINYGAGFIVCYANNVMTMPGLCKNPNANQITYIDGKIDNLC